MKSTKYQLEEVPPSSSEQEQQRQRLALAALFLAIKRETLYSQGR